MGSGHNHLQGMADGLCTLGMIGLFQGDYQCMAALLEESLTLYQTVGDKRGVATALHHLAWGLLEQANYAHAATHAEESLLLFREVGDREGITWALLQVGAAAREQNDLVRAMTLLQESLHVRNELAGSSSRHTPMMAWWLYHRGLVALDQGEEEARALLEQSLAMQTALKNNGGVAWSLARLSMVTDPQGDPHRSLTLLRESLQLFNDIGDKRGIAWCLEGMAGLAGVQHRPWHAARLFGAAAVLRAAINCPLSPVERIRYERQVVLARFQLTEGAWMAAWAEGQALSLAQAMTAALDHELNNLQLEA